MSILKQVKGRKPMGLPHAGGNLFLILVILMMTGCVQRIDTSNPLDIQATQTAENVSSGNPTSAPTLPSTESGNSPTGAETSSPVPTSAQPSGTQTPVSLTFLPDADASVKQSSPDTNYGNETELQVDSGTDAAEAYIHFALTEITGPVQNARLRVYTRKNGSQNGPAVGATDASWGEDELTWNNRPRHSFEDMDNREKIDPETWAEYDVTHAVTGNGSITFVLDADSGDAITFASRETDFPPQLEVTFVSQVAPGPTPTLAAGDVTFVGAGNIATCESDNDELTAQLLDVIPGAIFTTGNNIGLNNTYSEFMNCYQPTWGRHKDKTNPVPGDNEYQVGDSKAYYQYFNNISQYYAYNLGNWRIYGLNSEIGVEEESNQAIWLKLDLTLNPSKCVLAFWHRPRWSSGATSGNNQRLQTLWKILYDAGADVVVNGNEQNYERFMPMDAEGLADPTGMREFIVGTGGQGLSPFGSPLPTSQVRNDSTYGVLKFTLRANSYDWQFVPVAGSTFTDSGSAECR
jgi:hypothetical protein